MRIGLIAAVILLAGCVTQSSSGNYSSDFDRQEAAKTRMSLGLTYLKNNNYTQAKINLDRALEYDPQSGDVHYALAYYYQLVGENARADESYKTALKLASDNGDIANSYGAFKCQNGDYEGAKRYFLRAINNRQYANSAQTYENLALCAQSQGNIDDAISYLKDALNHQPSRPKSLYLLTELYIGNEQWALAKDTLARYEKVTQVSPDSLWMAFEIARGQGNWQMAKDYGDMLVSMFPQSPLATRYQKIAKQQGPKIARKVKVVSIDSSRDASATDNSSDNIIDTNKSPNKNSKLSTQQNQFHIVKQGENLYRISLMYNIKMATLQKWNNLDNSGSIFAGMKLWLVPQRMQEE